MKRRTFIAATTSAVFLAGCSSSGDDTSSATGTSQSTTTQTSGEMTGTTRAGDSTTTGTTTSETTSETAGSTETDGTTTSESSTTTTTSETRTVAFREYAAVADSLEVAVTAADTSDSYEQDGTTTKSGDGKTFALITFETKNSAQSSQSLPEGATASLRANGERYDVIEPAAKKWQQAVSSSVKSGGSASTTVAFEVPKEAVSSLGVAAELSYNKSGAKQVIRWNME